MQEVKDIYIEATLRELGVSLYEAEILVESKSLNIQLKNLREDSDCARETSCS